MESPTFGARGGWIGRRTVGRIYTDAGERVTTEFFHILLLPLFPMWGLRVTAEDFLYGDGEQIPVNLKSGVAGERIPLNWKSVVAGYLRSYLLVPVCVGGLMIIWGVAYSLEDFVNEGMLLLAPSLFLWLMAMFALGRRRRYMWDRNDERKP